VKLAAANGAPGIKDLAGAVSSGKKQTVLVPTGSEKGDRYYIKATWNPNDKAAVHCLNDLFNAELAGNLSLQDDAGKMNGHERYAYWYTKEWATSFSTKVVKCGGQASYSRPGL
jgi:hypothetical protein